MKHKLFNIDFPLLKSIHLKMFLLVHIDFSSNAQSLITQKGLPDTLTESYAPPE
jgi:hypothetical protein